MSNLKVHAVPHTVGDWIIFFVEQGNLNREPAITVVANNQLFGKAEEAHLDFVQRNRVVDANHAVGVDIHLALLHVRKTCTNRGFTEAVYSPRSIACTALRVTTARRQFIGEIGEQMPTIVRQELAVFIQIAPEWRITTASCRRQMSRGNARRQPWDGTNFFQGSPTVRSKNTDGPRSGNDRTRRVTVNWIADGIVILIHELQNVASDGRNRPASSRNDRKRHRSNVHVIQI